MPTIEQLRQEIANKETELSNCSRDLKELTTQRANQQRLVTRKENKINDLNRRYDLTATERTDLTNSQRELISDQQELNRRETERESCSRKETGLMFEIGGLKRELNKLETSEAVDYRVKSSYRGRFGAN